MKITGIRSKLVVYFLSLLSIIVMVNGIFAVSRIIIVNRYEQIDTNIFKQNELIAATENLITSYNTYRNTPVAQNLASYNAQRQKIYDIFAYLDKSIVSDDSRIVFTGVQKTIGSVVSILDQGVQDIKSGTFENLSARVTEANRKFGFVKENIANLLLKEIAHSAELQAETSRTNTFSLIFGGILAAIILIVTVVVSFFWSRQIIMPLAILSGLAEAISSGNSNITVGPDLVAMDNEVGSLARSFNRMIIEVESKINMRTKELQEERSRLLASINSLSFGFMIVNLGHTVMLKNKAVMDLFGYKDTDEITIKMISEKFGGFDVEAEAERCLKGKSVCEIREITYGKKILRGVVAPIMTGSGSDEKIGYVLLFEDITEAKIIERSRDEFFALASHELRTPLTAIRGNSDMIMDSFGDKITDPDVKEMLADINESAIRLIQIVNDFLEVSRIEQGKFEIKSEVFDMSELAVKVVRDLQGALGQKDVVLEWVAPPQVIPKVLADKSRIEQVLINLIGNSLKFTKNGRVSVSLEVSDQFVMVNVKDTGIGISEQNQARLFRKFQQAGESMLARDVTQGTGLGLYISQLLVSSMGGSLGLVSSELGKGSVFAFTIPIAGTFAERV